MKKIFTFILATFIFIAKPAFAQTFQIKPANPVLQGDAMSIQLKGVAPNASVKIAAERPYKSWGGAKTMIYRSEAIFSADVNGDIDLATTPAQARSGTYKGADLRGLFWSMQPTKTEALKDAKTSVVNIVASIADKEIASANVEFIAHSALLKTEKLDKFPGAIFSTIPRDAKRPAIIVLGGSEGGNSSVNDAALRFASRGFAAMSLPYYSPKQWPDMKQEVPGLPANFVNIEINRLNEARNYLRTRADVDGERIAIYGVSKGAEFVLLAATNFAWVKSAVAVVPSDVVWEGWGEGVAPGTTASFALNSKPFAFTPYKDFGEEFMGFQTGADVRIRRPQDKGRAANPAAAAAARIPVEKYKGALLVIGGQEDQIWNSAMMAHNIAERRAAVVTPTKLDTVSLIYTDAGHYLSGNGYAPTTQYDAGPNKSGGTPEGNAKAQADAWEKTIQFLQRTLAEKSKK
jgi:dienelactone hydrolase